MASLDSLAGDQRAVLQLVLGRGRSYAEIARLLSIEPAGVRARALAALDTLGPPTAAAPEARGLICDYLLGQLPADGVAAATQRLATDPDQHGWARALVGELAPLASAPLPALPQPVPVAPVAPPPAPVGPPVPDQPPVPVQPPAPVVAPVAVEPPVPVQPPVPDPEPIPQPVPVQPVVPVAADGTPVAAAAPPVPPATEPPATAAQEPPPPPSSRRGGMLLIATAVILVIAVVLVLVLRHHHHSTATQRASAPTNTVVTTNPGSTSQTATTSTSGSATAHVIAQINLNPSSSGSQAAGIAEILQAGTQREIAIVADHVPANTSKNSYAVWLYNSPTDAVRLGFVSPGVTATGKLSAASALPTNAARYKELIVTTETGSKPTRPGPILLQGTIRGL